MAKPILILRAASDAVPMAESLEQAGYAPVLNPLIEHICAPNAQAELDAVNDVDALLLTSAHALDGLTLPDAIKALPCFCVGQRTAASALKAGVNDCEIFPSASALDVRIKESENHHPLYLRGEHITQPFENTREIITYSADAVMHLTHEARELLNQHSDAAIAFTSARLVHLFSLLLEDTGLEHLKTSLQCFCMSDPIGVSASTYGYAHVYSATTPDLESLYKVIQTHYI